ncbi:hypothetical protein TNCV_5023191 [Trichonephila clavipes]|nr:hypothetical protein TNCV_5023191 [Trichonephila clavipes]
MENISRTASSTYKYQDPTLYSHSIGYVYTNVQIHGFCDSSEKAYCAVIYILSKDATQTVVSRLLTSKTRVSPVKPQSLPRLELCSALLLANLLQATFQL